MSIRRLFCLAACVVAAAACGSSAETSFYVLDTVADRAAAGGGSKVSVGVGPVNLPPYLDRPQIVTRTGPTTLDVADFDHWAEPLHPAFVRVVADHLSARLGTEEVFLFPWTVTTRVDVQVRIDVVQFDSDPSGQATLVARWFLVGSDGSPLTPVKRSVVTAPAASTSFADTAAALSEAVADLGKEIADAVEATK